MNALFALALLVSPSWAGVVMPVESGVAPAGPTATAVPVPAPSGGSLGMPALGAAPDLRGGLPLLPAPVPGLVGPAVNFVGDAPEAAAVRAEAGATQAAAASATARPGRAADRTPALPGKPAPGASSLAISLERKSAGAARLNGLSLSRDRDESSPASPLVEASALEQAQPEKAAGVGRGFFDQSRDKIRGSLAAPSSSERPAPVVAAAILEGGAFGPGYAGTARLAARDTGSAFGAGHGPSGNAPSFAPEGETLHDAVASAPGGAAAAGAVAFYRSAAPNGELSRAGASAPAAAAALPVFGAPRPLAIDLSGSGLIVRVRSALSGAAAAAPADAPAPRRAAPGPSTALLERGAMLEAFSVAGDYAARTAAEAVARPLTAGALRDAAAVPAPEPSSAPLWWAWFALPLFVAAIRGIL